MIIGKVSVLDEDVFQRRVLNGGRNAGNVNARRGISVKAAVAVAAVAVVVAVTGIKTTLQVVFHSRVGVLKFVKQIEFKIRHSTSRFPLFWLSLTFVYI